MWIVQLAALTGGGGAGIVEMRYKDENEGTARDTYKMVASAIAARTSFRDFTPINLIDDYHNEASVPLASFSWVWLFKCENMHRSNIDRDNLYTDLEVSYPRKDKAVKTGF